MAHESDRERDYYRKKAASGECVNIRLDQERDGGLPVIRQYPLTIFNEDGAVMSTELDVVCACGESVILSSRGATHFVEIPKEIIEVLAEFLKFNQAYKDLRSAYGPYWERNRKPGGSNGSES